MEHGMMLAFEDKIQGSTFDLYRYIPSIGLKMSRLRGYVDDVEQVLGITGIRVLAPIPNSTLVGFEVPRTERTFPAVPSGDGFDVAIGQTIMGAARRFDIRNAPHMLVAGSSGSGKSVFLNALIEQLARIPNSEMHLFDPKRVELAHHKSKAIEYKSGIEDIKKSLAALENEMLARYTAMEKAGVRSIKDMPGMKYKFAVIDEFGELMVTDKGGEIESRILRLAQMARAAGIHLIMATQSPRTDVIKGTIKANFPTKVAFRVAKTVDSIVILDEPGAEKLAGKGDMLFVGDSGIERLQGFLA